MLCSLGNYQRILKLSKKMFEDLDLYTNLKLDVPLEITTVRKAESGPNTLVLLINQDTSHAEMATLDKLLAALRLKEGEVEIWQLPEVTPALWGNIQSLAPGHVLIFGIEAGAIGLHFESASYEPIHFSGTRLLVSDALLRLNSEPKLKALLWKALQQMYKL